MSTNVQAMTIAMFGAAAGGYTAELEASVEASGVAAVANSIMSLQQPLLGLDLSDNAVWTDFVLGNLGINDTNAAYGEASAYFAARFAAGASRGDIVAEAVAYLLGTPSAEFAAIAEAFAAQVADAVEWSAGDGATALSIGALREGAGNTSEPAVFNLTAALATLADAEDAAQAALDAVAESDAGNDLEAGNEQDAEGEWGETYVAADAEQELAAAETAAAEADDAHELAIAALANARVVASDSELAADVTAAQAAITDAEAQEEYDAYVEALDAADAAEADLLTKTADFAAARAFVVVQNELDAEDFTAEVLGGDMAIWIDTDGEGDVDAEETVLVEYDAEGETYVAAGELTDEDYAGLTDLVAAANALYAADAADTAAAEDVSATFEALDAMDDAEGATDGFIDLYDNLADANDAVDIRDGLIEDVAEAAADLAAAEAYAAELADLVAAFEAAADDVTAAAEAIDDAGYVLATNGASTAGMDVYTADVGTVIIADFAAGDVIGVSGYTYNSGDSTATNNINALEFFVEADGEDVVVTFETETYGSDSGDVVTLTLTGVSLDELSIGSNYILAA